LQFPPFVGYGRTLPHYKRQLRDIGAAEPADAFLFIFWAASFVP